MTTEEKAAGSTLKAAARKKRPYRSQLTVLYIMAVIACVILGYIVGRRLLPGNEEQVAQSTLAGVGSGQAAGDSSGSGGNGGSGAESSSDTAGAGAEGQESEALLPPLRTPGASPDVTGAGIDDTTGAAAGGAGAAGAAGSAGAATPSTSPSGSEVPQVSLPVLGSKPARSAAGSQLQTGLQPQPQPRPASPSPASAPASSGNTASKPVKAGADAGERAASVAAPAGGGAARPAPAPAAATSGSQLYRVIVGRRASLAEAKTLEAQAKQAGLEVWISGSGPYQVQVGAFRSRANAVAYAEELQSRGFPEAMVIEPEG